MGLDLPLWALNAGLTATILDRFGRQMVTGKRWYSKRKICAIRIFLSRKINNLPDFVERRGQKKDHISKCIFDIAKLCVYLSVISLDSRFYTSRALARSADSQIFCSIVSH